MNKVFLLVFVLVLIGCEDDESYDKDGLNNFVENLQSVQNSGVVGIFDFPEWLSVKIAEIETIHVEDDSFVRVWIYQGYWQNQIVYYISNPLNSCGFCEIYFENGEQVIWTSKDISLDNFCSTSENWELIYEFGLIEAMYFGQEGAMDVYEFPIKAGTEEWDQFESSIERIDALQIPDNILTTISTEGLLETCLLFPYLTDIFFCDDFQKGFEALTLEFNGYQELYKRNDLTDVLLKKYRNLCFNVTNILSLEIIEQGRFTFRHFLLEFMLSQDFVLNNLYLKQEIQLFLLSFEHTKIINMHNDIFGSINNLPIDFLYAKRIINDPNYNFENTEQKEALSVFIREPAERYFVGRQLMDKITYYFYIKYNYMYLFQ